MLRREFTTVEKAVEVIPRQSTVTALTFDRVVVELRRTGSGKAVRYDSDAEEAEENPAGGPEDSSQFRRTTAPLRALDGGTLEVTWKPTGAIQEIDGLESLRARIVAGLAGDDPIRGVAENVASMPWLYHSLAPNVLVPGRATAVGEEGRFQDMRPLPETTGVPGYVYYRGTYRLASAEDGVARVEVEAEALLDPLPGMPPWPPAAAPGRNRLRLARGTCRAWSRIELATGKLLEDEHVTELDLHFVRPDGSGEVPIPTKVTQTTKLVR